MSADEGPTRDGSGSELSFLGKELPPCFELRFVVVAPGREHPFDEAEWRDALVVVEWGEIDLDCTGGAGRRFRRGDVICLDEMPIRALLNRGEGPAVLAAVSRRSRADPPEP